MIQVSAAVKVMIDYRDADYDQLGMGVDAFVVDIKDEMKELDKPWDFNEFAFLKNAHYIKVKDGIYLGSIKDELPHGYGELLFKKGVNHHPPVYDKNTGVNRNMHDYVYYEGFF